MGKISQFEPDVELDAFLVHTAMNHGFEGFLEAAFLRRDKLSGPDDAVARSEWLKKQSKKYRDEVVAKVMELENE